jgi:hypothetical protein
MQSRKIVGWRRKSARQQRSQAIIPNPETMTGAWRKTCRPVNPALTIMANALRVGDQIRQRLA